MMWIDSWRVMENNMKYDDALKQLETIVDNLEEGQALSMEEFKKQAEEAKKLLDYCRKQLTDFEADINSIISNE
ncbi:MAG TPA: exodeoxyribonuclease VII small subunit [Bacteroidales bacterium]|nr:exodeoxyribonuclease VII small subunit [Bacteroidales bacterium]